MGPSFNLFYYKAAGLGVQNPGWNSTGFTYDILNPDASLESKIFQKMAAHVTEEIRTVFQGLNDIELEKVMDDVLDARNAAVQSMLNLDHSVKNPTSTPTGFPAMREAMETDLQVAALNKEKLIIRQFARARNKSKIISQKFKQTVKQELEMKDNKQQFALIEAFSDFRNRKEDYDTVIRARNKAKIESTKKGAGFPLNKLQGEVYEFMEAMGMASLNTFTGKYADINFADIKITGFNKKADIRADILIKIGKKGIKAELGFSVKSTTQDESNTFKGLSGNLNINKYGHKIFFGYGDQYQDLKIIIPMLRSVLNPRQNATNLQEKLKSMFLATMADYIFGGEDRTPGNSPLSKKIKKPKAGSRGSLDERALVLTSFYKSSGGMMATKSQFLNRYLKGNPKVTSTDIPLDWYNRGYFKKIITKKDESSAQFHGTTY